MDTVFDIIRNTVIGHEFVPDNVTRKVTCRNPEHVGAWSETCWKAEVAKFIAEHSDTPLYDNTTGSHAQDIVAILDPGAVMVKYVFAAEGVDYNGNRAAYTDSSEDLAVWDEHGLLKWAQTEVTRKQLGRG